MSAGTPAPYQGRCSELTSIGRFLKSSFGQAAHASSDPWNGRSASDALELYAAGINYYREHVKPTVRIHYHIQDGGQVVNVVPDYSRLWVRVRDTKRSGMLPVYERIKEMAQGAAILADVDYKISLISGIYEVLVNREGGKIMQKNIELLGPIQYTEEEVAFGKKIQEATEKPQVGLDSSIGPLEETKENPGGGSTDCRRCKLECGKYQFYALPRSKRHTLALVGCCGLWWNEHRTQGMIYSSKAMSMTMLDLFENPELVEKVKAEYLNRKGEEVYEAIIPEGPPPIPNLKK